MKNALCCILRGSGVSRIKGYIFTNKKHSVKGIMSTVFGTISIVANLYGIMESFQLEGQVHAGFGAALLLSTILSFVGFFLGIISRIEKDKFYFFSYLGLFLNIIALGMISLILYAGLM